MAEIKIKTPNGNNHVSLTTANASGDATVTLPKADIDLTGGSNGQYLKTDGAGTLSWGTVDTDPTTTSGTNNFTVADGNLVIGTAGHGIDFSATANTSATGASMTSELLDWYEEGTWTPTLEGCGTVSYGTQMGYYTRIGRMVHAHCRISWSTFTTSGNAIIIGGMPFDTDGDYWPAYFGGWDDDIKLSSGYTWPSVYCGSPWDKDYFYLHMHKGDNVSPLTTGIPAQSNQSIGLSCYYQT